MSKYHIPKKNIDKFNEKIDSLISLLTNIKKQVNDNYESERFILLGCKGDLILFNVDSDRFVKSYWDLGYLDEKYSEDEVWEIWNKGEASASWCANQLGINLKTFYELLEEKGQPYELVI